MYSKILVKLAVVTIHHNKFQKVYSKLKTQ